MARDCRLRVLAAVLLLGCGGSGQGTATSFVPEDAGPDAAAPDAAAPDAAPADAAPPDRAPPDRPAPDVAADLPRPDAPAPDAAPDRPDAPLALDTAPDLGVDARFVWEDATCALETIRPQKLPFDLYLMLDSSFSMFEDTAAGNTKWDAVKQAIAAFIAEPHTRGLGLGLQYFPLTRKDVPEDCYVDGDCGNAGPCKRARTCAPADRVSLCDVDADCDAGQTCVLLGGCTQSDNYCIQIGSTCAAGDACLGIPGYCRARDICDAAAYAVPEVAIAPLPGVASALIASLTRRTPDGLSPTGPALAGALQHARARVDADPTRRSVVVLVSDGFPVECAPSTIPEIAALAQAAARATPPVPTFTIGVFGVGEAAQASANLDAVARAGGTAKTFGISAGEDVTSAFLAALNDISAAALACEYKIPPAMMGEIDFAKVNVQFTAGNGQIRTLGHVASKAACDPARGGWYYDANPSTGTPTAMFACEATCTELRADPKGQVDIVLGCRTTSL